MRSSPQLTDRDARRSVPAAPFVAHSELRIDGPSGMLTDAFRDRLGKVDGWPGFDRLEVWQDEHDETRFVMVSWWQSEAHFMAYMRSEDHRESHQRIPEEPHRPVPVRFSRFRVVSR